MDNHKKEVIDALELFKGNITKACASIGMPRSTFYNWKETDEEFKAACEEITEVAIDFVEDKLFQKINGVTIQDGEEIYTTQPDTTAIIFYLKTKGKKRGYVEKQEVEHQGGIILNFDKDDAKL